MKRRGWNVRRAALVFLFSVPSLAIDLDVESAKQTYAAKKQISDQALYERDEKARAVESRRYELQQEKEYLQYAQGEVYQLEAGISALLQTEANLKAQLNQVVSEIPYKEREKSRIEGEIHLVNNQLQTEKSTLQALHRELQRLEREKNQKVSAIQSDLNELNRLEREVGQLKNRLQQIHQQAQNARQEVQNTRQKKQETKQRLNQIESRLNQLPNEMASVDSQANAVEAEVNALDSEIASIESQIKTLKAQLKGGDGDAGVKAQIEALKKQKDQLEKNQKQKENDLKGLKKTAKKLQEEQAENQREVGRLNAQLSNLDQKITALENQIQSFQAERQQVQQSLAALEPQLAQIQAKVGPAQQEINQLNQQIYHQQSLVQNQKGIVHHHETRLQALQTQWQTVEQGLAQLLENRQNIEYRLSEIPGELQNMRYALRQAQDEVTRREASVREAEYALSEANSELNIADHYYRQTKSDTDKAYAYYQQVQQNYNKEREKVVQLAEANGKKDGAVEGQQSGGPEGTAAGNRVGSQEGRDKGMLDGKLRDFVLGYQEGRAKPQSAATFAEGTNQGKALAVQKAKAEDFPNGYNSFLDSLLGGPPSSVNLVDLSDVSVVPGPETGLFLKADKKAVGSVAGPSFTNPQNPPFDPPSGGTVGGVLVPVPSYTNYQAPCTKLLLPEFEQLCEDVYYKAYLASFESLFQSTFTSHYAPAYNQSASKAYQASLLQTHAESKNAGINDGAFEQAKADAFTQNLSQAKQEQFHQGELAVKENLKKGYMVFFRSGRLVDANGDGLHTPGEPVKLRVVVDNYGDIASPDARFQIRVLQATGLSGLVTLRQLPALSAHSRTTFEGVLSGRISQPYAGGKVSLHLRAESDKGDNLGEIKIEEVAKYPLELTSLKQEKVPGIAETVRVLLTYKNNSKDNLPDTILKITMPEKTIEIVDTQVHLPALSPGQSTTVVVRMKPTASVGGNRPALFVSEIEGVPAIERLIQNFSAEFPISRRASLNLYDERGNKLEGSIIKVKAGSRLGLIVEFDFHSTKTEKGPFKISKVSASHPGIKNTNNSTVSTTLGSASPSNDGYKIRFSYDIGRELKGQQGWVLIHLLEGNTPIHAPRLWMNFE